MDDNEVITAVREQRDKVHSDTPVAQIISRGRAVRARRRIPGAAGALVVAAGTALAVTTLLPSGHLASHPGSHPASHPASARLAAWTVTRQANGDITITINQLQNPAGLQGTLRTDGLPANVTFSGTQGPSASCQPYATSHGVLTRVFQVNASHGSAYLTINPSALPRGAGVGIFDEPGAQGPIPSPSPGTPMHRSGSLVEIPVPLAGTTGPLAVGLVNATPQCTG
jgi:hypothetical protein